MDSLSLLDIKKAIKEGDVSQLTGLAAKVAAFLEEKVSLADVVSEFADEDISEEFLQALFGEETEELVAKLCIEQADFNLAAWILKNKDCSDFVKEELAFAFTQEFSLTDDENGEVGFELYTQNFLTNKEKKDFLGQASQKTLLQLAIFYNDQDNNSLVQKLDNLNLSLFLQDSKVRHINDDLRKSLQSQNKIMGKNALSVLSKSYNLTNEEKKELINKALGDNDIEIAYLILNQEEITDSTLLNKIIGLAISSFYFSWTSIPARSIQDIEEYVILNNLFNFDNNGDSEIMSYKQRELAKKVKGQLAYNKYFSEPVIQTIKKIFNPKKQDLPSLIKGYYNLYEEKFYPIDSGFDLSRVKIDSVVFLKNDTLSNSLKLWKPNLKIEGVLEFKNKQTILTLSPTEQEVIVPWEAKNISDLRRQISERIDQLNSGLKLSKMNPTRAFGVEIELCMTGVRPSDIALTIEAQDLYDVNELPAVNSSKKSAISSWAVKSDESVKHVDKHNKPLKEIEHLSNNRFTAEIITPKLYGEEGLAEIKNKLNTLMQEYGDCLSVNYTCGLHVHHDMNQFFEFNSKTNQYELPSEFEQLIKEEFAKIQESIYSLCAPHRRDNIYCPRFEVGTKVKTPVIVVNQDENSNVARPRPGFNIGTGYGTLEYRMHEATLDIEQILNWVKITHHLFDEIINKCLSLKSEAVNQLTETLKLMEIEKLKKINNEDDLAIALKEINDFIKNNAWAKILITT